MTSYEYLQHLYNKFDGPIPREEMDEYRRRACEEQKSREIKNRKEIANDR